MGSPSIQEVFSHFSNRSNAVFINGLYAGVVNENGIGIPFLFWLIIGALLLNPLLRILMLYLSKSNYRGTGCEKDASTATI